MEFGEVTLYPVNGHGPEDVVVDGEGRIYTGVDDGRILRLSPDGQRIDVIADTGGRPLGLEL
jgi:sugar lactone lactonase YvrE